MLVWIDAECFFIDFSFSQVFKLNCQSQEEKGHRLADSPGWAHFVSVCDTKAQGMESPHSDSFSSVLQTADALC